MDMEVNFVLKIKSKIKYFFQRMKRSCKWFVRMWNNHDFDYNYLMEVIVWKMKDMIYQLDFIDKNIVDLRHQEHRKDNGYDGDLLKSLEECIEIGERLIEDDYVNYPSIVEDWFSNHDSLNDDIPKDIKKLMYESFEDAEKRKNEDNEKFFNIMKTHRYDWWS